MSDPTMDPERAAWIHRTVTDLSGRFLTRMLADLQGGSTAASSRSPSERIALAALRPWMPKLVALVSDRISSADPAALERMAGALATGIEDVLAAAPGAPLPRWRAGWAPDGGLVLFPVAGPPLLELEQCPECPHFGGQHDELLGCTAELENGAGCSCTRVGCGCAAVA